MMKNMIASTRINLPLPGLVRPMTETEAVYLQGDQPPAVSSFLLSNSKYLNSPLFRDAWSQVGLRRYGWDLPTTYDLPAVFQAIADVTDLREFVDAVAEEKCIYPAFAQWVDARKLPTYSLDEVRDCAPGTLGAALFAFMSQPGIEVDFMRKGDAIETDVDYIMKRRSAGHDIEHIVTGFGTNQLGEHAIALLSSVGSTRFLSPVLAKNVNMATAFLTAASFMRNAIHYPAVMPHLYSASQKAIEMGLALPRPLYMVDWDGYLDWLIDDICADLGIVQNDNQQWQELDHLSRG